MMRISGDSFFIQVGVSKRATSLEDHLHSAMAIQSERFQRESFRFFRNLDWLRRERCRFIIDRGDGLFVTLL